MPPMRTPRCILSVCLWNQAPGDAIGGAGRALPVGGPPHWPVLVLGQLSCRGRLLGRRLGPLPRRVQPDGGRAGIVAKKARRLLVEVEEGPAEILYRGDRTELDPLSGTPRRPGRVGEVSQATSQESQERGRLLP